MASDQAHGSTALLNHRDISGEEAWTRRCSLPVIVPWVLQSVKTEGSFLQDASSRRLSSALDAVEEGEILETQPCSKLDASGAHSFLYSIPQWQPPPKQPTGLQPSQRPYRSVPAQQTKRPSSTGPQPSQRPTQRVPGQRTRPPSTRLKALPPLSWASMRQQETPVTMSHDSQVPLLPKSPGPNEKIPEIYRNDVLDGRIGIRPRNKKSIELQQLKGPWNPCGAKGLGLPRSMKIVIQQFMVANGYICPHQHMLILERPVFRNSLLVRLDLHNTFKVTKETNDEKRRIKTAWASIDGYVSELSREWKAQGVFEQVPEMARPTFAAFTGGWTDRDWDGSTFDFTRARILTTVSPVLSVSPDDSNTRSRPTDSEASWEAGDNAKGSFDRSYAEHERTRKRFGQDGPNNQVMKRARLYDYVPLTDVDDEANGFELTGPKENGLPVVIEAIQRARATMLDLAPLSAKDLAVVQQDWTSHGFPSMLAETLTIGRAYTATMGRYFDNALNLLSLLEESGHWKADHTEVQVDCACQQGGTAPEYLRNGRIADPRSPTNSEVEVRHPYEWEDTVHDRSQKGKVSDRQIIPIGSVKLDRASQPDGAASNDLREWIASVPPMAMVKKAQVDHPYQPTAATLNRVPDEEVANPATPMGTAKYPYIL